MYTPCTKSPCKLLEDVVIGLINGSMLFRLQAYDRWYCDMH